MSSQRFGYRVAPGSTRCRWREQTLDTVSRNAGLELKVARRLESQDRRLDSLAEAEHLEELAHLRRGDEAVHRARALQPRERHGAIPRGDQHRETARGEEVRMRGEAADLGAALLVRACHGAEID